MLSAFPAAALAHAELVSSSPAPGANLEVAPTEVTLTFDDELNPAASGFAVVDHHGTQVGTGEVDLEIADRNVLSGSVEITEPGVYTVAWSATGLDGHAESGEFSFGYATDEEIPAAGEGDHHDNPDTALRPDAGSPLATVGLLLVVLAALLAARRQVVR